MKQHIITIEEFKLFIELLVKTEKEQSLTLNNFLLEWDRILLFIFDKITHCMEKDHRLAKNIVDWLESLRQYTFNSKV
jgi:hypothetical protein